MGHLAHSADMRATRLEISVPWIIESAISVALTPLQNSIDTFTTRIEACKSRQGEISDVTTLKVEVDDLRKDVDYLKSIDFTSLLKAVDNLDTLETSEIPPATTRDIHRDDATLDESDVETNDEQIEVHDAIVNDDLADMEDVMFESVRQTCLRDTTMGGSNGEGTSELTLSTDAPV
ncbi:hypothetical protein H5410_004107 [Solanum commersonii]|uniref:Polyprotein protein n=1 Tax=Solanum commersonii TaxID=4109 RepID=A0A9J6B6Q2_SOLCO|nr:hypothetical protein H5410_004107 [Solanum commersonii]